MEKWIVILGLLLSGFGYNAQCQGPNWGDYKLVPSSTFNGVTVKFDWLRENMFIKISEDGYTFSVGGDDVLLDYLYDTKEKVFKLKSVVRGQAYLNSKIKEEHKTSGFPIIGLDQQALRYFVIGFLEIINDVYKLNESYKNGFDDSGYENGYGIELYGKGNAYIGEFKSANRNGKGRYILIEPSSWQIMDGNFRNGIQHGEFIVTYSDKSKGHGQFVEGRVDGVWRYKYEDGKQEKFIYENGGLSKRNKGYR